MVAPEPEVSDELWSFDTTDDTWARTRIRGGSFSFRNVTEGVHASDPSTGTSFYTGGWTNIDDDYDILHNGTVKFQSFDSKSPQWTFERSVNGDGQWPYIAQGSSTYLLSYLLRMRFIECNSARRRPAFFRSFRSFWTGHTDSHSGVLAKGYVGNLNRIRRVDGGLPKLR